MNTSHTQNRKEEESRQRKAVAIVEHPEDVSALLLVQDTIEEELVIISTEPGASWELEKLGIPFKGIDSYYDCDVLYRTGMENYFVLERLCTSIDTFLVPRYPFLSQYGLKPARDNFIFLKRLYDNLVLRIFLLSSIITTEHPGEILVFAPAVASIPQGRSPSPFTPNDNIFSILLKNGGWPCTARAIQRIDISSTPQTINELRKGTLISNALGKIHDLSIGFTRISRYTARKIKSLANQIKYWLNNPKTARDNIFLLGYSHWNDLEPEIYGSRYRLRNYQDKDDVPKETSDMGYPAPKTEIENLVRPFCISSGIDFTDPFLERIMPFLSHYIRASPRLVEQFEQFFKDHSIKAVLCGERGSFLDHIPLHVADTLGIPVLAWQHGDGPFYPPIQLYVEIMNADIHLCYGEGHRRMLTRAPHNTFPCRIEPVGSPVLEALYYKGPGISGTHSVLYVTTSYYNNNLYVNNFPTIDTDLWGTQKKILETLAECRSKVTFKLFPEPLDETFLFEFLRNLKFSDIATVKTERSFRELLPDHDVVICDYPSTPVIESIAAHKTVFVLLNYPFFNEEALPLLKKRVYWSSNRNEFVSMIRRYLNGEPLDQHPDLENTEYLETYGIHKLDGNVGERTISLIREAITGAVYRQ